MIPFPGGHFNKARNQDSRSILLLKRFGW